MFLVVIVLFLSFSSQNAVAGQGLRFRDLNPVPGTYLSAINDQGVVVANHPVQGPMLIAPDGTVTTLGLNGSVVAINNRGQMLLTRGMEAFLVQPDGTLEPRTYPGTDWVRGIGLSNSGIVTGWAAGVGAVLWDEAGTPSALRVPLSRLSEIGTYAMSINDAGEIAGAYVQGSGPYGVYRRTADGFFRDVGRAIRFPAMALSNSGVLYYTHSQALSSIITEIRSNTDAVVFLASDSTLAPRGSIPVFTGMSPNGQLLIGSYTSSSSLFQAEVCPVEVTPSETAVPLEGGTVSVAVKAAADCEWYSEALGRKKGDAEVTLTIPATQASKTSHYWVAWHDVVVRQGGGACEYRLPGSAYLIGAEGGTVRLPLATAPDCTWFASGNDHVELSPATGTGPAELRVAVKPSDSPQSQRYTITVGDAALTIFQDPVICLHQVTFPSQLGAGSGAALLTQQAQPGCHVYSYAEVDWLRPYGLVQDSPSSSHEFFFYQANPGGQSRVAALKTMNAVVPTQQQPAAPGEALLVEPATGTGPRQRFRFTFAEPVGEPEISIGKACTIHHRTGFFPFTVDGSCQLNDASVTTMAGRFRTVDLDVTLVARGPLSIMSGTRSLGAFLATGRSPDKPQLTAPKPQSGAIGFSIDSDHGYGGTFRMVMESANRMPIRTAALTFWTSGGPGIYSCTVELNVSTRQLSLSTYNGNNSPRIPGTIELGGPGALESDACIVKGAGAAFIAQSSDGSRAVWDVTVLFRSTWNGLRAAWVDVVGSDGVTLRQPGSITYTIDPQVMTPSVAVYSDLVRVGISANVAIASARVGAGACLFEYDPVGGLREATGQRCRLDAARSAAVASGGNLTLVLAYSGDPSGTVGLRPLRVEATPVGGVASGWFELGQVPSR